MNIDTLIAARWIIPVEPGDRIWEQYALAVSAGKIVDILPQCEANEKYQADEIVDLDQHALIPGFINAHTHAAMSLMRGYADDLPLMEWLHRYIWPLERQWMGEAFVRDGTELAIAEMIRGGITCFNDSDALLAAVIMALLAIAGFIFLQWFMFDTVFWMQPGPGHMGFGI